MIPNKNFSSRCRGWMGERQSDFCHLEILNPPLLSFFPPQDWYLWGLTEGPPPSSPRVSFFPTPRVSSALFVHCVWVDSFFFFPEQNRFWGCKLRLCKEFTVCFSLFALPASDVCFQTNYELSSSVSPWLILKQGGAILSIMRWKSSSGSGSCRITLPQTVGGAHDLSWPCMSFFL